MAKPTLKPRWATTVTADPTRYVEPPAGKKDIGWDVGERPPAQYENWLRGTTGQWIDWLDTFESTAHTWTATQTFTPSTAVPGIVLGYNSATDTADETPTIAFADSAGGVRSVVDRLGGPSLRWVRREILWQGHISSPIAPGPAGVDFALDGETELWQRHSGGAMNLYDINAEPRTGAAPVPPVASFRSLRQASFFEAVPAYHIVYGSTIWAMPTGQKAVVVAEFPVCALLPAAPTDTLCGVGFFQRGSTALPGSSGRDLTLSPEMLSVVTANLYAGKWQVYHRVGGVTTFTDTGVLASAWHRVRFEVVTDTNAGGPRTNVYLDGVNVYSTASVNSANSFYSFESLQKPIVGGLGGAGRTYAETYVGPVRIQFRADYV